ncbi:MAG: alpha-ketoglutarate decarboxylase [Cellulophaga sp.]|nr:alpha-ketoglutarate decarboxylase [Cellulophaga sp.]
MKFFKKIVLKKCLLTIILLLVAHLGMSQNNASGDFWSNVRYGGGIGLGFGNGFFNGSISPSAIYQFNDKFSAGTQLSFNYAEINDDTLFAYGGSLISLYNVIPAIQLSAEIETLRINRTFDVLGAPNVEENYWSPAAFVGAGYGNRNFMVGVRYNLLNDDRSIYPNGIIPFVRVFF